MSTVCKICGKRNKAGNSKSHSNVKTRRVWKPNIQSVLTVNADGIRRRVDACTKCIKAGKVKKISPSISQKE